MGGRRIGALVACLAMVTGLLTADPGMSSARGAGSNLTHEVTATDPAEGGQIQLEDVTAFDPAGGQAVFEPGLASEEPFTFTGIDSATHHLVGVTRNNPTSHPAGAFVEALAAPQPEVSSEDSSATPESSPTPEELDSQPGGTQTVSATDAGAPQAEGSSASTGEPEDVCVLKEQLCIGGIQPIDLQPIIDEVGRTCPELDCVNLEDIPDPIETVCGPGLLLECLARVERLTNDLLRIACPPYGQVSTCANENVAWVMGIYDLILDAVMNAACPGSGGSADMCYQELVARATALVDSALRTLCPPSGNITTCASEVVDNIWAIYYQVLKIVCPSGALDYCYMQLKQQVENEAYRVVDYLLTTWPQLVDHARRTLCPPDGDIATCADEQIDLIMRLYDQLFRMVCPSGSVDYCYTQAIDEVNRRLDDLGLLVDGAVDYTLRTLCPPDGNLVNCGESEIAFIQQVIVEGVRTVYEVVCGESTTSACIDEYEAAVNKAIGDTIETVCGNSDAQMCIDMLDSLIKGFVESAYRTACPADSTETDCLERYIATLSGVADAAFQIAYEVLCPADSSTQSCVDRYVDTVTTALHLLVDSAHKAACPTDPSAPSCLERYEEFASSLAAEALADTQEIVCPDAAVPQECSAAYIEALRLVLAELTSIAGSIKTGAEELGSPTLLALAKLIYDLAADVQEQLDRAMNACEPGGLLDMVFQECTIPGGPGGPTTLTFVSPSGTPLEGAAVAVYLDPFNPPCSFQPPLLLRGYTDSTGTVSFDVVKALAMSPADPSLLPDQTVEEAINVSVVAVDAAHAKQTHWSAVIPLFEPHAETVPINMTIDPARQAAAATDDELINVLQVEVMNELVGDGGDPQAIEAAAAGPEPDPVHPDDTSSVPVELEGPDLDLCFVPAAITTAEDEPPAPTNPEPNPTPAPGPSPSPTQPAQGSSPAAPSGLTAQTSSTSQINLYWTDNSETESDFRIERRVGSGEWGQIAVVAANRTSFADSNLSANTTFYYRVRAVNEAGSSSYSNSASATTSAQSSPNPPAPPSAPHNLHATAVSTSVIELSWYDNSTTEQGFKLERAIEGGNWTEIAYLAANATSYRDQGLLPNRTYSYRMRAFDSNGHSDYSNWASATTPAEPGSAQEPPPHNDYNYYYYDEEPGAGDCWDECKVKEETRTVKVSQHHSDLGIKSTFEYLEGRETTTGIAVKVSDGKWEAGGSILEQVARGAAVRRTLEGDNKHVLWLASYRWYKWKYTQSDANMRRFHTYRWKPHHWTGDIVRDAHDPNQPPLYQNEEWKIRIHRSDGVDWKRYRYNNKTFETGVTFNFPSGSLDLMSRAGFATNTALEYENVGPCSSRDDSRYLYGQGQDPTISKVIYAWTYCA
jgi:hypothetical protein